MSVLVPFCRNHYCPVVFNYLLQYTGANEDEAAEKHLWSKGDYAKLSASILAVDFFLF